MFPWRPLAGFPLVRDLQDSYFGCRNKIFGFNLRGDMENDTFFTLCSCTLFNEFKTFQHSEAVPEIAATCLLLTLTHFCVCVVLSSQCAPFFFFFWLPRET